MAETTTYLKNKPARTFVLYSWADFEYDVKQIVEFLRKQDKKYVGVYAIPRGGLVLGVRLSHELDIPLVMGGVTSDILVVDEIADSGGTILPFKNRCDVITIFKKIGCEVSPTFWVRENVGYVLFPWESSKERERCLDAA